MGDLPRLGLAVAGTGPEPSMAGLALLAGLHSRRVVVQHFRARACLTSTEVVRQVTGLPCRHLDAWLMPPEVCRAVFVRGSHSADLAVVEGTLDPPRCVPSASQLCRPGRLGPVAEALDLPTIAVVPCPSGDDFHLPNLPEGIDAILLDGLADPADFPRLKHLVGLLTRRPVVGAVGSLPEVRRALASVAPEESAPADLIPPLAASFLEFADLGAIDELARSRPMPECCGGRPCREPSARVRVAYALDKAFGGYFPDTFETLEALGAELVEFSPLKDEALPPDVDLVLIGCGFPDLYAETLAANQCLHAAREGRTFVRGGGSTPRGAARPTSAGRWSSQATAGSTASASCRSTPRSAPPGPRRPRSSAPSTATAGSARAGRSSAAIGRAGGT